MGSHAVLREVSLLHTDSTAVGCSVGLCSACSGAADGSAAVEELRCGNSSSPGTASPPAALWAVQPPAVLCPWLCPGLRSADGGLVSPGTVWVKHSRCGGWGRSLQPPRAVPLPPSSRGREGWWGEGRRGNKDGELSACPEVCGQHTALLGLWLSPVWGGHSTELSEGVEGCWCGNGWARGWLCPVTHCGQGGAQLGSHILCTNTASGAQCHTAAVGIGTFCPHLPPPYILLQRCRSHRSEVTESRSIPGWEGPVGIVGSIQCWSSSAPAEF